MSKTLIIAGTHGQEPQSTYVANKLVEAFALELVSSEPFNFYQGESFDIIPDLNRYGLKHATRGNANGVDLNRNMPASNWTRHPAKQGFASDVDTKKVGAVQSTSSATRDEDDLRREFAKHSHPGYYPGTEAASEIETKALVKIIKHCRIISIHTNHFVANANKPQLNYDGSDKSIAYAQGLADALQLPLTRDIGYPTPGSLGSYSMENGIDCITLEFDDNLSNEETWQRYGLSLMNYLS